MYTNENEITKSEFNELDKVHEFDKFTPEQVAHVVANIASLVKKGEENELSEDELDLIKSGTAEVKALKNYIINEMVEGKIVKRNILVSPKQINWFDVLEKSETGEKIEKGIYLDTELNIELERVGIIFEKGKKAEKKEETKEEKYDEDMYKSAIGYAKEGGAKKDMYKNMSEKYPEGDKDMMKKCLNKAYKDMSDDYMKKAEESYEDKKEDEEGKTDKKNLFFDKK